MIALNDLLVPAAVVAGMSAGSKKKLFQQLGAVSAEAYGLDAVEVTAQLNHREKLGSTGFGGGIAIPHGKIEGLAEVRAIFVQLDRPVDFAAIDDLPVDLICALLSPPDAGAEHLKALARVSRCMRDRVLGAKLRGVGSTDALFALLTGVEARDAV